MKGGEVSEGTAAEPAIDLASVSVVFVTYNSHAVIGRAVASVPAACDVIIVDNASPAGTDFAARLPRPVRVLAQPRNLGFGAACNLGARSAQGRLLLFLNPDAALEDGALERLLAAVSAYGPALLMPSILAEDGRLMRKEGSILEPVPRARRLSAQEIAGDYCTRFVHGAAFLVEKDVFLDLGGFDEAIFLYHEDDDLGLRALARHIPIIVVRDAQVRHAGGKSSTPALSQTFRINRWKMRSEIYVRRKYHRAPSFAATCLKLAGGVALAALTLNAHRVMIRAGKLAGLLDMQRPGMRTGPD
ncbi:glycosyltransferase family 2 protein [Aquabacter sp. L1I39]|uniref:glycosyltransferase family 2 protein n=1 Tax=Aquabacter sp. L1I39 TaxID=2820278 RepID=UPI001ADCBDE3|nr:glycosyltransferase family 2 protein [Aquabacter sp. L1I39]QTL04214.1 glycosyltransferase family 2 protein [Aquabacter sp. L1I39]